MKTSQQKIARLTLGVTATGSLVAAPKPEEAVKYRQGALFALGWNAGAMGAMGAMVKGDVPFDAKEFSFMADRIAALAPLVLEGFTPDSKGAKSHARPELWENLDDFKQRTEEPGASTTALAAAAGTGAKGAMKKQVGDTVQICQGGHDEYRKEQ